MTAPTERAQHEYPFRVGAETITVICTAETAKVVQEILRNHALPRAGEEVVVARGYCDTYDSDWKHALMESIRDSRLDGHRVAVIIRKLGGRDE